MSDNGIPQRPDRAELLMCATMEDRAAWHERERQWKARRHRAQRTAWEARKRSTPEGRDAYNASMREYQRRPEQKARVKAYQAAYYSARRAARDEPIEAYMAALPASTRLQLLEEHWRADGLRDFNEPMIVNELRLAGYEVAYNGYGLPDLTARGNGREFYVEVKAVDRDGLSARQSESFDDLDLPVYVLRSAADARAIDKAKEKALLSGQGAANTDNMGED